MTLIQLLPLLLALSIGLDLTEEDCRYAFPEHYPLEDAVITIEHHGCFVGSCPIYIATFDGSGSVHYEGRRHTKVQGEAQGSITRETMLELVAAIYRSGYFEGTENPARLSARERNGLVEVSRPRIFDAPMYDLHFTIGTEYERSVRITQLSPEPLLKLVDHLSERVSDFGWVDPPRERRSRD